MPQVPHGTTPLVVMGFLRTADLMVKLSVSENPRWRLDGILDKLQQPLLHIRLADRGDFWFTADQTMKLPLPLEVGPLKSS